MNEAQTPIAKGVKSAFELSPLKRAAALIAAGNHRNAQAQSAEMAKRCQPSAQRQFISRAAMLLNEQGGHKMPVGAVAIADFNRAKLETATPATPQPSPATTSTATTATSKSKKPLTLAQKIARLTPEARAALKDRLDAFNAGKPKATSTKSKATAQAAPRPAAPAAPAAAVRPAIATVKVGKRSRWTTALNVLHQFSALV